MTRKRKINFLFYIAHILPIRIMKWIFGMFIPIFLKKKFDPFSNILSRNYRVIIAMLVFRKDIKRVFIKKIFWVQHCATEPVSPTIFHSHMIIVKYLLHCASKTSFFTGRNAGQKVTCGWNYKFSIKIDVFFTLL